MTKMRIIAVPCLLALLVASAPVAAQEKRTFEYVVKFVCGQSRGSVVAPGQYFTAINVHNPGADEIEFRKHFSIALPAERAGPVSRPFGARLGADQALEIDCPDIIRHASVREPFAKGFAVLESGSPLDVVAVYTAAGSTRQVETMQVERVAGREVTAGGCADLIVEKIDRPEWDGTNHRSIIRATIKNIGTASAVASYARVIDPSTMQPGTSVPQNAVAATSALAPGASVTVVFYLDYWVFNPDAALDVTADYKNDIAECDESNNSLHYQAKG